MLDPLMSCVCDHQCVYVGLNRCCVWLCGYFLTDLCTSVCGFVLVLSERVKQEAADSLTPLLWYQQEQQELKHSLLPLLLQTLSLTALLGVGRRSAKPASWTQELERQKTCAAASQ